MNDALEDHARELLSRGYTIVPAVLNTDELERARMGLARLWEEEREVGKERGWHNKSWIISYMLPAKDEFFRELPLNPRVLPLMQRVLGENCIISSLNGLMMVPGGETQRLHLDQMDHTPGLLINVNAMYALDDFTIANGCTRVVPGSHEREPGARIDRERDEKEAIFLEAAAGSVIAFNGGMVHAGSANRTRGPRRCAHVYYSRPWVRSQWDFLRSIDEETKGSMSEEEKRMYGFYAHEQVYDLESHSVSRR